IGAADMPTHRHEHHEHAERNAPRDRHRRCGDPVALSGTSIANDRIVLFAEDGRQPRGAECPSALPPTRAPDRSPRGNTTRWEEIAMRKDGFGGTVSPGAGGKPRISMRRSSVSAFALTLIVSVATPNTHAVAQTCVGDCNSDERVTVDELIVGVDIALGGL